MLKNILIVQKASLSIQGLSQPGKQEHGKDGLINKTTCYLALKKPKQILWQCLTCRWNRNYKLGIFEQKNIWIGIGSVCMRTPEAGLYRIAKLIRQEVPDHHLHCFGIGKISWVKELEQIGIDSCDSSVASVCTAYNKLFINDSQFQLPKITYRNQEIAALQFAYNVQSTLAQLSGHQSKWIRKTKQQTTQLSLF